MSVFLVLAILLVSSGIVSPFQLKSSGRSSYQFKVASMHFDEAINGNTKLGSNALPGNLYLASNRFKVRDGAMPKFEKRWAERKSRLALLPGFKFFSLFRKIDLPGMPPSSTPDPDPFNYISFTLWATKDDFNSWRTGEAFKEAHGGGGIVDFLKLIGTALFIIDGSPKPAFYDALLVSTGEKLSFATDNGWRTIPADGVNFLPGEIFMAQNKFKVLPGREADFEAQWASRESRLQGVPGFVAFSMLRRDADKADDGFNYISSTIWRSVDAFNSWRTSDSFKASHAAAAEQPKCYEESPRLAFYEGKLTLVSEDGIFDATSSSKPSLSQAPAPVA